MTTTVRTARTSPTDRPVATTRRSARGPGHSWRQWLLYAAMAIGGFVAVAPLLWVILSALRRPDEILQLPLKIFPDDWTNLANFAALFTQHHFDRYFANSFIVSAIGIASSLVIALLAAYAFAFHTFRFKEPIFALMLALFMVPPEALVIPQYLMLAKASLINTYLGLAFPDLFTVLGLYLLRQFMEGIPKSYVEAARVDGAGELRILLRIIVPMVAPAIAVFIIIKFLFTWNTFLWPLLVAQTESMYTVTVGLVNFAGSEFNQWNLINAATVLSMLPTIVLFVTLQRYLVKGVAMSGMK